VADGGGAYATHAQMQELGGSLARLHMRYPRGRDAASGAPRGDLLAVYKNPANIRTKYKGQRVAAPAAPVADDAAAAAAAAAVPAPASQTSGIPIFGVEGAADRVGWSKGHIAARQRMSARLGVATENSHALGHADFGTDHELSAPAASKAQNTEQLAIELAMRTAASQLNKGAGLDDGTSLLHAKITDVLHPQTGDLMARRYKLIRRANKDDHAGTVVFDHLMDGERAHISKADAMALGQHVHRSVMTGAAVARSTATGAADPKGLTDRKGLVGGAPTLGDIADHQDAVATNLNAARGRTPAERTRNRMAGTPDRRGVGMVGPAFTDASFPATAAGGGGKVAGQTALDTLRGRIAAGSGGAITQQSLLVSGSLPADNQTKLLTALGNMHATHRAEMVGAAGAARHGINDELDAPTQAALAASMNVQDPRAMGDPSQQFIEHTGKAVKALRRMEADNAGSGVAALTAAGIPLAHLQAAHARRNQYFGITGPLVPPISDDDIDDDDGEDAHDAAAEAAAGGGGGGGGGGGASSDDDDDDMVLGGTSSGAGRSGAPLLDRASSMFASGSIRRERDDTMGGGAAGGADMSARSFSFSAAAAGAGDADMSGRADGDTRGGKSMRRSEMDDSAGGAGRVVTGMRLDADMEEADEEEDDDDASDSGMN